MRARCNCAARIRDDRRRCRHSGRRGRSPKSREESWPSCATPTNCTTHCSRLPCCPPVAGVAGLVRATRAQRRAGPAFRTACCVTCAERVDGSHCVPGRRRSRRPTGSRSARRIAAGRRIRGNVARLAGVQRTAYGRGAYLETLRRRARRYRRRRCFGWKPKASCCAADSAPRNSGEGAAEENGAIAACSRAFIAARSDSLRREIEPVTAAEYIASSIAGSTSCPHRGLHGVDGTLQIVRQLRGLRNSRGRVGSADSSRARCGYRSRVSR